MAVNVSPGINIKIHVTSDTEGLATKDYVAEQVGKKGLPDGGANGQIIGKVGDKAQWIDPHSGGAEVDATLTQAGKAADAAVVGERIGKLSKEIAFDPTKWGLPVLALTGDISAMTKDNAVDLAYEYEGRTGTASVKWQGSSSLAYAKKNYTIKFDEAFEAHEGWGEQKKYCFKANFIDVTHARNVVNAKLWGQIVQSRGTSASILKNLPNAGAVDGFPCVITLNGKFHGLYTWNIPKDAWMFRMGSGAQEAIVCADINTDATLFKGEATLNGDFELEYMSDENNTEAILTSLNGLINSAINATEREFYTDVLKRVDLDSAIDYYIYVMLIGGLDMVKKNYILATFDGSKWFFSAYDMDSTYGLNWDGKSFFRPNFYMTFGWCAGMHRMMELIRVYKLSELKKRYKQLRETVLSENTLFEIFMNFTAEIPAVLFDEDQRKWPSIPSSRANTIFALLEWYRRRVAICDAEIDAMTTASAANMFDYGESGADWINPTGNEVGAAINVSLHPETAIGADGGGLSKVMYRKTLYSNDGGYYAFGATFNINPSKAPYTRIWVQPLDVDGNIITTGVTGRGTWWEYVTAGMGFCANVSDGVFKLPEGATHFRVGFLWSAKPESAGTTVQIADAYLLPVTD